MPKQYLSSETIYAIDQFTINEIGIPSAVLMERAAYSAFLGMKEYLSKNDFILLVAGSGNNGADAVALARMLYLDEFKVHLYITSSDNHSDGMSSQLKIAENISLPMSDTFEPDLFERASYIVDGIFGIGISREIEGNYQAIIECLNKQNDSTIVALDIPSGLSAKTGEPFETVTQADRTYTFGFLKKGMESEIGKELCGKIDICDLGYPENTLRKENILP